MKKNKSETYASEIEEKKTKIITLLSGSIEDVKNLSMYDAIVKIQEAEITLRSFNRLNDGSWKDGYG